MSNRTRSSAQGSSVPSSSVRKRFVGTIIATIGCLALGIWITNDDEATPRVRHEIPESLRAAEPLPLANHPSGKRPPPIGRTETQNGAVGSRPSGVGARPDFLGTKSVELITAGQTESDARLRRNAIPRMDLQDANLREASLDGVDYAYADLRGADLTRATITRTDFRGADLRHTTWRRALVEGSFRYADLSNADLRESNFGLSDMRDARLRSVKAGPVKSAGNELVGVAMDGVNFTGADLRGGDFRRALLFGTVFTNADLRGADLRNTMFSTKATWEGAIYDDTTLFDGAFDPQEHGMIRQTEEYQRGSASDRRDP